MDKKLANILLISDQDFEYKVLLDAGYKNVTRFGSMLRAYEYFKDHKKDLDGFDVVLMGSSAVGHRNCHKYNGDILNYVFALGIPYMSFFSSWHEENEEKKLFYVSYPDTTSLGMDLTRFLSVLQDIVPTELNGKVVSVPEVIEKEKILPKRREDVKVLFMVNYIDEELVDKFFKDEGFTNYTFIRANNFSFERNLELFPKYDLVVADQEFDGALSLMGNEYNDYQKDKDNNTYIIVYELGRTSIKENHIRGFGTDKPNDKKEMSFKSMVDEDNALLDVLRSALKLYTAYNTHLDGDEYPSEDDLRKKFDLQYEKRKKENETAIEKYMNVRELYDRMSGCRNLFNKGFKIPNIEGLKIDILQDGMSVAFMVGSRETVRVSFEDKDFERDIDEKISFYLEYLNNNGKMKDAGKHIVCSSYYDPNLTDISDDEARKIEVLLNRVIAKLSPVISEKENLYKRQVRSKKNRNRRYNRF